MSAVNESLKALPLCFHPNIHLSNSQTVELFPDYQPTIYKGKHLADGNIKKELIC